MSKVILKQVLGSVLTMVVLIGATGCIVYPEKQDYGESVRHMQAIQVANPGMASAPQDGERARRVLKTYREDVSEPQDIQNDIVINVGQ